MFVVGNRVMLRHILRQSCRGKQAMRAILYDTGKKSPPPSSFSLPRSTSETTCTTLPKRPRSPQNTGSDSKLSNLTSHQPQRELSNPRESHSSTVLQHTRSDTCGLSSFLLPSLELDDGAGAVGGAGRAVSLSQ